MRSLVSASAALDVLCAYATLVSSQEYLLPASLVINAFPRSVARPSVRSRMSFLAPMPYCRPGHHAWWNGLPGQAVRVERLREWGVEASGRHPVLLVIQYVTEVPGGEQALVLTFSTPALGWRSNCGRCSTPLRPRCGSKGRPKRLPSSPRNARDDPAGGHLARRQRYRQLLVAVPPQTSLRELFGRPGACSSTGGRCRPRRRWPRRASGTAPSSAPTVPPPVPVAPPAASRRWWRPGRRPARAARSRPAAPWAGWPRWNSVTRDVRPSPAHLLRGRSGVGGGRRVHQRERGRG